MRTMIDPPSGHRFGFPKELPNGVEDINLWLEDNGYPRELIEHFGGNVPCGMWYETDCDPKRIYGMGTWMMTGE